MPSYHVAQCNIGRVRAPLDSPQLAGFVAALEPVNRMADEAPGFVWRLQTEAGDATAIRAFEDDMLLLNMSVWESIEALAEFTYRTPHRDVMRRRREWFERLADAYLVLWWVRAGTLPTVVEARARLEALRRDGPTPQAFTFHSPFPPPDASRAADPVAEDWFCPT
jgi:Domain of unknown function (DUF3291)